MADPFPIYQQVVKDAMAFSSVMCTDTSLTPARYENWSRGRPIARLHKSVARPREPTGVPSFRASTEGAALDTVPEVTNAPASTIVK